MSTIRVRIIRSVAAAAAVGGLVLTGISPAMAVTRQDCAKDYQALGFSSHQDCLSFYFGRRHRR